MNWFIITHNACNLHCDYCQNEPHPDLPLKPSYSVEELKSYLEQDQEPDIAFYGGEPLLNIPLICDIMSKISARHWTIQTNGILLHKLPTECLQKFDAILISVDGDRAITDRHRGKGVYDTIVKNIADIRRRGFNGDLIARMAVTEDADIYRDVKHLLTTEELGFDHVHWQLDAQWDAGQYTRWRRPFEEFVQEYNKGITKLVDYWLEEMYNGKVLGIVPFLGLYKYILSGEKAPLHCGAGQTSFAIRTDGVITFCPLPPEYEFSLMGNMPDTSPSELYYKMHLDEPCNSCEVLDLCGGRCMFANKSKLWGEEGFNQVCQTVKHLIHELLRIKPHVAQLIADGTIQRSSFAYPSYNNTTEIIP